MLSWFVVHTHANAENKAAINLQRQGFTVYLPQYLKKRSHARKVDWVRAPLFPRYLFLGMDKCRAKWRSINSTIGVTNLVSRAGEPAEISADIIEMIRSREDEKGLIGNLAPSSFKDGDAVRFLSGALADQCGIFQCRTGAERVEILVNILGRPVSVRVSHDKICAAA